MTNTRNTVQRELILTTVRSMDCHPTAEEVYDRVAAVDGHISKGTVYRNLALLSSMGRIRKVCMPGTSPDRYDFNLEPHYHAICRKCGKIVDVGCTLQEKCIYFHEPFMVEDVDLVFSGLCGDCCCENNGH